MVCSGNMNGLLQFAGWLSIALFEARQAFFQLLTAGWDVHPYRDAALADFTRDDRDPLSGFRIFYPQQLWRKRPAKALMQPAQVFRRSGRRRVVQTSIDLLLQSNMGDGFQLEGCASAD